MPPDQKLIERVDRLFHAADSLLDRVRKRTRRKLDVVPEPIEAPDPFTKAEAAPSAPEALTPKPLGDPGRPGQVYGRRTDMWSGRAVRIFHDLGLDAPFIDLDDPNHIDLEAQLIRETKQYELPWVFLRGVFLGNYHALDELARLGELEDRCRAPGEAAPKRRKRGRADPPSDAGT